MKRALFSLLPLILLTVGGALPVAAQDADAIVGLWHTEPKETGFATVRVTHEGGAYQGEIIALSEPLYPDSEGTEWAGKEKVDRNNSDEAKTSRPIIGMNIVWGFQFKNSKWEGGHVYDPENGKTYKSKITLNDDGTLSVRGFVGFSMLGRTTTWTPVEETP